MRCGWGLRREFWCCGFMPDAAARFEEEAFFVVDAAAETVRFICVTTLG